MQKPMKEPPPAIDGMRVLYYAILPKTIRYSGCALMFVGGKELKKVPGVAICERDDNEAWLYYCDVKWDAIGASPYASIEASKRRAERMYPGISAVWVKPKATIRQVKDYLKHHSCYLCNNVTPGFAGIKQLVKFENGIAICNNCIDTLYGLVHEQK